MVKLKARDVDIVSLKEYVFCLTIVDNADQVFERYYYLIIYTVAAE